MNSHIHDDHFEPTRHPEVSGSRASQVEGTLTTPPPVVQATQVEDEPIQQKLLKKFKLKRNYKNKE